MAPSGSHTRAFALLCTHWFFATAALGVFFPYFALFLRENVGLTSTQVGIVIAIPPLVGLIAQPAWGQVADRTGSRVSVLVLLGLGTALGFAALSHAQGLAPTVLATMLLALFMSALFPMSTSVSFATLAEPSQFGRVRVWGTIGYFMTVVAMPPLLHRLQGRLGLTVVSGGPSEPGLPLMFYAASVLALLGALAALALPRTGGLALKSERGDVAALFATPAFVRVLIFNTGIQFFLHGPMLLFPLYVRSRGGSMTDLSHMWICMLLLEVPLIFASGRLFARFGVTRVMLLAAFGGGVRWTVCALVPTLALAYPVQALHALVVMGLGVGTALHVERIVPARLRSTAQSTVVMVGSSIGGALSTTLGGFAVDHVGIDALFLTGGLGALAWSVVSINLLRVRSGEPAALLT